MEVIVTLGKTNTMTNTWGKTKTETDKDKKLESKRISVKFSNWLQRHLADIIASRYEKSNRPPLKVEIHRSTVTTDCFYVHKVIINPNILTNYLSSYWTSFKKLLI